MSPKAMIITAGCLLVGGWFIHGMYGAVSAYAAESAAMDSAMLDAAPFLEPGALADRTTTDPYLTGGVIVVNKNAGQADSGIFTQLPPELRVSPERPLGTIVTYEHTEEQVGVYRDAETGEYSGDAYQATWKDLHHRRRGTRDHRPPLTEGRGAEAADSS